MNTDQVRLETPEHVELEFELAGIGSRFLAGFVDSFLQAIVIVALGAAAGFMRWMGGVDDTRVWAGVAVVLMSAMLIIIAYYMAFELLWGGQTPGKRAAGLVVVRDDGGPIALNESAIRNILRFVDILPIYYTVGMISILATKQCKRLGDMAAGTIVVKVREFVPEELSRDDSEEQVEAAAPAPVADPLVVRAKVHVPALTPQDVDTVRRFVERRLELEPTSRAAVATRIAEGLRHKFPALSPAEVPDAEVFLNVVHQAYTAYARERMGQ